MKFPFVVVCLALSIALCFGFVEIKNCTSENEVLRVNSSICQPTCPLLPLKLRPRIQCIEINRPRCVCDDGFIRNREDNRCIPLGDCPSANI
ncbi:cysteine-rich protease inhibitor [Culex quinquefasciatus]|uniref:Cysteine-rich protease inhibitor n=1 Tax=Culex quinquefasciatus TaxID=7176 RepID=B0X630_CULQU|nr:cysteine-rich protease inhibitor [Culex quinquefasciatus]|eukprot:XP_001865102.1 cysteine-rich protease inhibitor [Culex quinquefasciatus]